MSLRTARVRFFKYRRYSIYRKSWSRTLALLDKQVGYAVQALRDGSELSLAVCEALYTLRVAYCHLTAHHTHKDEVEDMIELYENHETDNDNARRYCALQLVLRIATQYNLHRGRSIIEELKMVMNCFIQRLSFIFSEYGRSLNSTTDAWWEYLQAEIKARDSLICESRPISDDNMSVDDRIGTAVADPPVATPDQHLHALATLQGTRQRAVSTRSKRIQNALDRGDWEVADFYDQELTMVNLMWFWNDVCLCGLRCLSGSVVRQEPCLVQLSYVFADYFNWVEML